MASTLWAWLNELLLKKSLIELESCNACLQGALQCVP
jgi:hypothetical protein